ncbi:MAG: GTPase HflX [Ignavibacteria bacterium]|nr:GTPase HflX [Ignavibacteria bacterium]
MIETKRHIEKTVLVCYSNRKLQKHFHTYESLYELKLLAEAAGANVVKFFFQENDTFDPRYMIGKGKVIEIANYVQENNIELIIFENELSYTQLRNLEQVIKCKIIDKSNLILDIFATNAKTAQAKLQVELAQLEYLLPRLTKQWTHLSKQYGGIGTKGPGETQIETDRRLIKRRISVLKEKLKKISTQQIIQSDKRKNFIRISIVGYTNSGKSTILNLITKSNVLVENKLFATLDTSTKALYIKESENNNYTKVLISDTVGFIKNLPHHLVESFKSTLSEVVESDILLNVTDISNPNFEEQMAVVKDTLNEINAGNKLIINVFNKIDLLNNRNIIESVKKNYSNAVTISALKKTNIDTLLHEIKKQVFYIKENRKKYYSHNT